MQRNAQQWQAILAACGVAPAIAATWGQVFADTVKDGTFSAGDAEIDDFLGQVLHESEGLTRFSENLDYKTAARLCANWPSRFPTIESATPFLHNPQALANKVYGGRLGNAHPGDGWRYRGRGPIQITGRDNYAFVGDLIGQDLIDLPELLEQPHYTLEATIAWWERRIPDSMLGDPERITRRVNGGLIGLADREAKTEAAARALA